MTQKSDPKNPDSGTQDYAVFLPQTEFPMRANLPEREQEILDVWEKNNLWQKLRDQSAQQGRTKYILHDGPPYANGHLHIGHAENKILKDVISRAWQARGYDSNYVPGWDCHGLPIEWKVEENFRAANKDKQDIPINEFRNECKKFAEKWIDIQRTEFKRLGVFGDWQKPYLTMKPVADAAIARNIGKFLMDGSLYKGTRPVMWSAVERTALADAEVEYKDHKSPAILVRFPIAKSNNPQLADASIIIWTTTPWTIPGNRAVAHHNELAYQLLQIDDEASTYHGQKIILAPSLIESFLTISKLAKLTKIADCQPADFTDMFCNHPLARQDEYYNYTVPVLHADFVTDAQGTGFVHVGPANGTDDYQLALKHGLEVPDQIADDSAFRSNVGMFGGARILNDDGTNGNANGAIITALIQAENLLGKHSYTHSYPHSWRSKAPVIYRNTAQWFISMEKNNLRDKALAALKQVNFFPKAGQARLTDMIAKRPDWCISRQRAWGVPLPIFVRKADGEVLRDEKVMERIIEAFAQEGSDCWFSSAKSRFLGADYNEDDYEQVQDVVDVWFDSGSTHSFVLDEREELHYPADLYLEGTDQHRGWFHSSLLVAAGTKGTAPYRAVLTHGFALDEKGRKMSKSEGNVLSPDDVTKKYGADILRLWVVNSDYTEDTRIGDEILKRTVDHYRRIRNSLRFMLGNLNDTDTAPAIAYADLPELERYVLHKIHVLDAELMDAIDKYDYTSYSHALYHFCHFLSFIYFDIRKDCLYCDGKQDAKRQAAVDVLSRLFDFITTRSSIILCFTAEEAWQHRYGKDASVFLNDFSAVDDAWRDDELAQKWERILNWRAAINQANEQARKDKQIRSSLEAQPKLTVSQADGAIAKTLDAEILAEIMITAPFDIAIATDDADDIIADAPNIAQGDKCGRCWKILPEVTDNLCNRCRKVC